MKLKFSEAVALFLVVMSFFVGVYFYPMLPDKVASHWGIGGEVDGYISKFWGAYLMPIIGAILWILFLVIPRIDPKKHNIEKFRKHFDRFIVLLFLFLIYIYGLTLAWNLGVRFSLIQWMSPALAILFFSAGVLVSNAEPNWSIGIRTPWTLSCEKVWKKTHKTGGVLFKICGAMALLGMVWPMYAVWFVLAPILIAAVFTVVQSYVEYHREHITKK
ncbi:SdpI family protein [Candidatus Falkowbacteria bacterium]|nr:SdpI family protein [Candidatus Falkowbacteria bacterium]